MKSKPAANGRKKAKVRDPQRTKARLLEAARDEFSAHGLSGGRVNRIASNAGVNKQLLYYYFSGKENLYARVLEQAYRELRLGEQSLNIEALAPVAAIEKIVEFNFDFLLEHPYFVALVNEENLHQARHIKASSQLFVLHNRLLSTIGAALERGWRQGVFKRQVDPADLYISIASLSFFYHSNNYTLSAVFQRDLSAPNEIERRREHIVELILGYLTGS